MCNTECNGPNCEGPRLHKSAAAEQPSPATMQRCAVYSFVRIVLHCIALNFVSCSLCNIVVQCAFCAVYCLVVETIDHVCSPLPSPVTNVFPLCFICLLCHHSTSHHYAIFIVMVRTHEHSTTVITTNLCSWIFTAVRHTLPTLKH